MISEKLYRALLLVYPSEHRREYGEPMVQLSRDRMRRDGGGVKTPIVWVQMIFDLVCSASREHKESVMLENLQAKRAVVRSGKFLLWSLGGSDHALHGYDCDGLDRRSRVAGNGLVSIHHRIRPSGVLGLHDAPR